MNDQLIYKEEAFVIVGCCMEVHKELGKGFNEIVYKDALEIEFKMKGIDYKREKEYDINYKGHILPRKYISDFTIMDKIILEAKAIEILTTSHLKQTLNYLAASKLRLGIIVNFGEDSLKYKRIIL